MVALRFVRRRWQKSLKHGREGGGVVPGNQGRCKREGRNADGSRQPEHGHLFGAHLCLSDIVGEAGEIRRIGKHCIESSGKIHINNLVHVGRGGGRAMALKRGWVIREVVAG